jgi:hypothetical protein
MAQDSHPHPNPKPNPETFTDYDWILMVSDKGMTLKVSDQTLEALGKRLHNLQRVALPWILTGITTFGGAGVMNWLHQQPETPAHNPEEVTPQK